MSTAPRTPSPRLSYISGKLACLSLIAVASTLGGCATLQTTDVSLDSGSVIDYEKVVLVEQWARANNTTVMWVNKPYRQQIAK